MGAETNAEPQSDPAATQFLARRRAHRRAIAAAPRRVSRLECRRHILLATLALGLATATAADFAKALSNQEIQSAGLAKPTPEGHASLEALVQRYKQGAVAVIQQPVEKADRKAGGRVAAEGKAAAKPEKKFPVWVGALIARQHTGDQPEKAEALESRLAGNFSGWTGRSRRSSGRVSRAGDPSPPGSQPTGHKKAPPCEEGR